MRSWHLADMKIKYPWIFPWLVIYYVIDVYFLIKNKHHPADKEARVVCTCDICAPGAGDTYVSGGIFIWASAVIHRHKNPRILRSFLPGGDLSSILFPPRNTKLGFWDVESSFRHSDQLWMLDKFMKSLCKTLSTWWRLESFSTFSSPSCLDKSILHLLSWFSFSLQNCWTFSSDVGQSQLSSSPINFSSLRQTGQEEVLQVISTQINELICPPCVYSEEHIQQSV